VRTALLVIVGVLLAMAAALYVASFRRDDPSYGLIGMTAMIVAAIHATVHAGLTS
jgi:hypothetical protein